MGIEDSRASMRDWQTESSEKGVGEAVDVGRLEKADDAGEVVAGADVLADDISGFSTESVCRGRSCPIVFSWAYTGRLRAARTKMVGMIMVNGSEKESLS